MTRSEGARLVKSGAYQPAGRRQRKRIYLWLSFLPFMLPLYLFTPDYRLGKPDHVIERVHRLRTWIAIIGALATTLPYLAHPDFDKYVDAFAGDAGESAIALVAIFLISAGLLVFLTPLRWRRETIRLMVRPALMTIVPFGLGFAGLGFMQWVLASGFQVDKTQLRVTDLLLALFTLWIFPFFFMSIYLVLRHLFNSVDANLLLPPVVTTLFGWWIPIQRLIWQSDVRPVWLDLLAAVITALVLTAISAWEVARLFRRGITPATGPYPPPPPLPQPYPPYPGPYPPHPGPYPPR